MNETIPYEDLRRVNQHFFGAYQDRFKKMLEGGWYVLGEEVASFEQEFAAYCGTKHCVGVASGLDALSIALRALALPPQSEVIVPANTYIASIIAIVQQGLTPVLVEPDMATYNLDPNTVESAITPKTRAIVAVHLYGKLAPMDAVLEIAQKYTLWVVEDAAQAHGAHINGRKAGSWGHVNAFSFYPTKNLGALGDAGAITTNHTNFEEQIRLLRNYGSKKKYFNEEIGYNSRLDELQAGFLRIKLNYLDAINAHKRKLAALYFTHLDSEKYVLPAQHPAYYDVFHIFPIRHAERDRLREYLLQKGVKTEIHYPVPPHHQKALQHLFKNQSFPITEEIHQTVLSVPVSFCHSEEEITQVIALLNEFY